MNPAQPADWSDANLVFVLSLPRAGSTLLQRLLGRHPAIATASESWLLIPQLYALRETGALAEYGHQTCARAIDDFRSALPAGRDSYLGALRGFALDLYRQFAGPDTRYFLDKTPRYALIAEELFQLFPRSRFIVLWRHPAAVAASMVQTFGQGRWRLYDFHIDLYHALEQLLAFSRTHGSDPRVHHLSYEALAAAPAATLAELIAGLELPAQADLLERPDPTTLDGRMGDKAGRSRYAMVSADSLDHWPQAFGNPLRRRWLRRYLRWIGSERMERMGYDLADSLRRIDAIPASRERLASDALRMGWGAANNALELRLLQRKWRALRQGQALCSHY